MVCVIRRSSFLFKLSRIFFGTWKYEFYRKRKFHSKCSSIVVSWCFHALFVVCTPVDFVNGIANMQIYFLNLSVLCKPLIRSRFDISRRSFVTMWLLTLTKEKKKSVEKIPSLEAILSDLQSSFYLFSIDKTQISQSYLHPDTIEMALLCFETFYWMECKRKNQHCV